MDFGFSNFLEENEITKLLSDGSRSGSSSPYMGVVGSLLSSVPSFVSAFSDNALSMSALDSNGQQMASTQQRIGQQQTRQGVGAAIGVILSILTSILAL